VEWRSDQIKEGKEGRKYRLKNKQYNRPNKIKQWRRTSWLLFEFPCSPVLLKDAVMGADLQVPLCKDKDKKLSEGVLCKYAGV
jgi:hypothetical protein